MIIDSWTGGPPSNDDLAEKNSQQSFYTGNMRMVEQEPKEPTGWGAPPPTNPNGWGQPPPKIGNWQQPPPGPPPNNLFGGPPPNISERGGATRGRGGFHPGGLPRGGRGSGDRGNPRGSRGNTFRGRGTRGAPRMNALDREQEKQDGK